MDFVLYYSGLFPFQTLKAQMRGFTGIIYFSYRPLYVNSFSVPFLHRNTEQAGEGGKEGMNKIVNLEEKR